MNYILFIYKTYYLQAPPCFIFYLAHSAFYLTGLTCVLPSRPACVLPCKIASCTMPAIRHPWLGPGTSSQCQHMCPQEHCTDPLIRFLVPARNDAVATTVNTHFFCSSLQKYSRYSSHHRCKALIKESTANSFVRTFKNQFRLLFFCSSV